MKRSLSALLIALAGFALAACEPMDAETAYPNLDFTLTPADAIPIETPTASPTSPVALNVGTAVIPPTPTFAPPLPSAYTRTIPKEAYAVLGAGTIDEAAISPESAYLAIANAGVVVVRLDTFERVWSVPVRAHDLAWSPNGRLLAGLYGGGVVIWLGHTGERVQFLELPNTTLDRLAWSPDGQRLAAISNLTPSVGQGEAGGALTVWRVEGIRLWTQDFAGAVGSFHWSPDGKTIATTTSNGLDVWNSATGESVTRLDMAQSLDAAWSPDGSRIAVSAAGQGVTLLDAATLAPSVTLEQVGDAPDVRLLAWSPDGRQVAGYSGADIRLWDSAGGKLAQRLDVPVVDEAASDSALSWSADARWVILSRHDGNGLVIDAATGQTVHNIEDRHQGQVMVSPDGRLIVTVTGAITVWRAENMQPLFQAQGTAPIGALSFSPDGAFLFSGSPSGITQWDIASAQPIRSLFLPGADSRESEWQVSNIGIYPQADRLNLSLRRAETVEGPRRASAVIELATGNYSMVVDPLGGQKPEWSPTGMIAGIVWSADGALLANSNASGGSGITVMNTTSGEATLMGADDLAAPATDIAFSANSRLIAAIADGDLICWNVQTGRRLFQIRGQAITDMAWSPDGKTLAMATSHTDGGRILVWDVVNAKLLAPLEGHTDRVTALAFSPEGNFLASGSADGTIILWIMQPQEQP